MHRFRIAPQSSLVVAAPRRRRAVHETPESRRELEGLPLEDLRLLAPGVRLDERDLQEEPLLLIVSRERSSLLPKLRELLHGEPEVSIVVDRRFGERRDRDGNGSPGGERRATERRRRFSYYLL